MTTSDAINEIAAALAKAQAEMGGAIKDSANPFFKSKYADLSSVREAVNGPLTKHGIAVVQSPSTQGAVVSVATMLIHTSGQWIRGEVGCTAKDDSPQAVGSAITYLRRYALQSFAGVAPEDDDGEAAHGRGPAKAVTVPIIPRVVSSPAGFDDWLIDLGIVAANGTAALEKAWKGSKADYRQHLTTFAPQKWAAMKQAAAKALVSELV
jgi:hypothetical protein